MQLCLSSGFQSIIFLTTTYLRWGSRNGDRQPFRGTDSVSFGVDSRGFFLITFKRDSMFPQ